MPEAHPDHVGLPALYGAEVSAFRGRWKLHVIAPGPEVVVGPVDLGPADTMVVPRPEDPGRYMIDLEGEEVPVLPRETAVHQLEAHGFVVAEEARDDSKRDHGWTQVASALWTAPCRPTR
ncbi:hypothetical protein [Kitasatospora sp. NRRL B-11411]|uniref:hypothetical protein n=1 Tax=Kitasatospora sp. NRRL B-11411 TaxID=1463822 RepID=UPI0004C3BEAB|nr:hypothetical protein [Kitasatospora sp. NRRL B-11411]